jgi:hypothetical protein
VLAFHGQHAFALGTVIALAEIPTSCFLAAAFSAGSDGGRRSAELWHPRGLHLTHRDGEVGHRLIRSAYGSVPPERGISSALRNRRP